MQNIEEIYKKFFETVNKYLFCLTHNNDISEELTQETFCIAVQKINTYLGGNCERVYIDKETGIMIGSSGYDSTLNISSGDIMTMETIYEYGTVTEDDFIEPNIGECEKVENINELYKD